MKVFFAFILALLFSILLSAQDFPGSEVQNLVDGQWEVAGSHWAYRGAPATAVVEIDSTHSVNRIEVYPFAGSSIYFYNDAWRVRYLDVNDVWKDFTNVVKLRGAAPNIGPGISVTGGDPGITGRDEQFLFYEFTFDPVRMKAIAYTVTSGDRDGDSNGAELLVYRRFTSVDQLDYSATAIDDIDGDVSSSLVWTSSIDGSIGSGPEISVTLSEGEHEITATAQDNDGNVGSETTSIEIEQ